MRRHLGPLLLLVLVLAGLAPVGPATAGAAPRRRLGQTHPHDAREWRREGTATVGRDGAFRLPLRTRDKLSDQCFRACTGSGRAQRRSRTIQRFLDFPDGDVLHLPARPPAPCLTDAVPRHLRLLLPVALLLAGLAPAGPATAGPPPERADRSITLRTTTQHLERGGRAVLAGTAPAWRPGTRVVVQGSSTTPRKWHAEGTTAVGRNRTFRLSLKTGNRLSDQYFRACIGSGAARRCSPTLHTFFDYPDGDVVVQKWSPETVPGDPLTPTTNPMWGSPVTVSGRSNPRWRTALAHGVLGLEQDVDGSWTDARDVAVTIDRRGRWTLTGRIQDVGKVTRLRTTTDGSLGGFRSSTGRVFTTRSWQNFSLDEFAVVSGSLVEQQNLATGVPKAWSPTDDSATFNVGRYCRTLYTRVGYGTGPTPSGALTASVAADGTPLLSTPVTAGGGSFGLQPVTASDITSRELVTIADAQTPDNGDHAYFQQYATCSF